MSVRRGYGMPLEKEPFRMYRSEEEIARDKEKSRD